MFMVNKASCVLTIVTANIFTSFRLLPVMPINESGINLFNFMPKHSNVPSQFRLGISFSG